MMPFHFRMKPRLDKNMGYPEMIAEAARRMNNLNCVVRLLLERKMGRV